MMDSNLTSLWIKIENFDIDGEKVAFPFARKLAKQQGWSQAYANRVIEEYRRFVFLSMACGHAVSPSPDVDEAWHLHLTYTKSYWDRMTKEILPKPLHHNPSKGGSSEDAKHTDWYARTLEDYVRFFGSAAPSNIWPVTGSARKPSSILVDRTAHWVIPKVKVFSWLKGAAATAIGVSVIAGCMPLLGQSGGGGFSMLWMILIGAGVVILGGIFWAMRSMDGGMGDPMNPNDPNYDPRREHTGMSGPACSSGSGGYVDHGVHHVADSSDSGHDGSGDSGGGDSGGDGGGGCGGGCSS